MKLSIALKFLRVSGISTVKARKAISTVPSARMMRVSFLASSGTTKSASAMAQRGEKDGCRPAVLSSFHEIRLVCRQFPAAFQHAVTGKVDFLQHSEFMERVCGCQNPHQHP